MPTQMQPTSDSSTEAARCARKNTSPVLARVLNTQYFDRHSRRSFARRWALPNHHYF